MLGSGGLLGGHEPETTLEEDVTALGLEEYFGLTEAKKTAGDKSGAKEGEKEFVGRTNVPVRTEDGDDDDDDADIEEDEDADDVDIEEDEDSDDDEGVSEDETVDEDENSDDPKLESAFEVVNSFRAQMSELDEDDSEFEGFEEDEIMGVLQAYDYIVEALLGEARAKRGKKRTREQRIAGRKRGKKLKKFKKKAQRERKKGKKKRGKIKVGGKWIKKTSKKGKRETAKRQKRAELAAKGQAGRFGIEFSDVKTDGSAISELVSDLADLRSALVESTQPETTFEELLEGFTSVHDTATAIYEKIAAEVTEAEDVDPDEDERVQIGRHFEGIANDAAAIIEAIKNEEADIAEASEDLAKIAADLHEAMEAMKEID
jgi:hypothetical protein